MKAVILTCYESNEERVEFVYETLKQKDFDIDVITTDFSHIKKSKRNNIPNNYISINTKPYSKNLSLKRITSHRKFSKDAFSIVEDIKPDLIWLMIPANSLAKQANEYKKNNPSVKIIIDVIDMWPESLPVNLSKQLLPFKIWKNLRSNNLNCADYIVSECDMYQEILSKEYNGKLSTIYWSKDYSIDKDKQNIEDNHLSLCYLGSINNIIDTDLIAKIISNIDDDVKLHVIGEGENTEYFLNQLQNVCDVTYYGPIRDEDKKAEILNKCHAGLNIYKKGLYIGLTVKCIDYFENGLPIINNIDGDTRNMVDNYNLGFNVDDKTILDSKQIKTLRNNNLHIYDFYKNNFSKESFIEKCNKVIDEVLK